jgi:hypothetical protein
VPQHLVKDYAEANIDVWQQGFPDRYVLQLFCACKVSALIHNYSLIDHHAATRQKVARLSRGRATK